MLPIRMTPPNGTPETGPQTDADAPSDPLCVFCGAPWDEPMMVLLEHSAGCPTCGYGAKTRVEIEVYCSVCGMLVYKKEVSDP